MMALRWAMTAVAAASLLVVGCQTESRADVPSFPDLGSYSPVNVQDYTIALPNPGRAPVEHVYFLTPDGVSCSFAPANVGIAGSVGCSGAQLPGVSEQGPYTSISTTNGPRSSNSTPYVDGSVQGHKLAVLPAFHSIAVDGMICGVDDKGLTACKDTQGRGFILSPAWSGWLPKV